MPSIFPLSAPFVFYLVPTQWFPEHLLYKVCIFYVIVKKKKKGGQVKHNSLSIDMTSYACFVSGYLRPLAVCFLHSFMRYECMDYDFFVLVSCNPCWSTEHQPTWLYIPIKPYILQSEPNQESIYIYIFLSLFTLLNDSHSNVEGET